MWALFGPFLVWNNWSALTCKCGFINFFLPQGKIRTTQDGSTFRFCSDSCFIQYHRVNNLPGVLCSMCCSVCSGNPLTLKDGDGVKTICGDECLAQFKEVNRSDQNQISWMRSWVWFKNWIGGKAEIWCGWCLFSICRGLTRPNPALCVWRTTACQTWWRMQMLMARCSSFAAADAWWCTTVSGRSLFQVHAPQTQRWRLKLCKAAF